ncbi:Regulator of nonsense transcripts UPF3 [Glycine max]|nr:Regulator of nonsense transcripts UPF3 [Glycine max]
MKVRSEREKTKVVIRHLSPSLTLSDFFPTHRFSLRFSLQLVLLPSRQQQRQMHSRAYIDFKCPDDVFEFTEFFDGHVFVNERGAQYKVIVEYAPSQRVPKPSAKKMDVKGLYSKVDVMTDPDYLEFLKLIAKPQEHLPSAEIQLERKEAEQADKFQYHWSHSYIVSFPGASKETPIVTPLMEYIRQKPAADSGMHVMVLDHGGHLPSYQSSQRFLIQILVREPLALMDNIATVSTMKLICDISRSACDLVQRVPLHTRDLKPNYGDKGN